MCGISGIELLVIIVAAIIFLGPEKLPDLLKMAGKASRELRKLKGDLGDMTQELRDAVPVDEMRRQMSEDLQLTRARASMKQTEQEIDALRARPEGRAEDALIGGADEALRSLRLKWRAAQNLHACRRAAARGPASSVPCLWPAPAPSSWASGRTPQTPMSWSPARSAACERRPRADTLQASARTAAARELEPDSPSADSAEEEEGAKRTHRATRPAPGREAELDASRLPFTDHLRELRTRTNRAVAYVAVAFGVAWAFHEQIFFWLMEPYLVGLTELEGAEADPNIAFRGVIEPVVVYLKTSLLVGFLAVVPLVLLEIWLFVAPGLQAERRCAAPFPIASVFFFLGGVTFCRYLVLEFALTVLLAFGGDNTEAVIMMQEYSSRRCCSRSSG